MPTTVTGKLENLGQGNVSIGTFVRFFLRGAGGNQPRVNGTAIIAPTLGNVYYFDFVPNASGVISGTLWSTRDSTGLLGGDIETGGVTTAVWYGMVVFVNGKAGPETPIHAKNTATFDISNVTPISSNPVVTAPTGDSTYARLDSGNQPFTGTIQALGVVGTGKFDSTVYLDGTTNATLAAAITAVGTSGTIIIPPSAGTVSVGTNATIPAGVALRIDQGAILSIATGVTVQINGAFIAGPYKVFTLNGTGVALMAVSSTPQIYVEWWGGAGDNTTDNQPALNAAINVSNNGLGIPIQFLCGQYLFNSKPNSFGVGTMVSGCATGSTPGVAGTFLIANYSGSSCASATNCEGFMVWDGSFGSAAGTGGGLRNVTLYRASNKTTGAAIKLTGADDNHRAGWWRGDHILVSGAQSPAGTWSYGWLVDGHNNSTPGTQGIRDNACTDCWFTNTSNTDSSIYFVNCAKCFWVGGELFQAGGAAGSAGATVTGTGGAAPAATDSVEITLMGTISGDVQVDQASNVRVVSEHILNNATFTSNAFNCNLIGRVDGTVTNSSTTSVMAVDGVASTNNTLSNVGGPIGAVASGQTPPTQTAGAVFTRTGAAAGTVFYGDATCFTGMSAASTFNFNCGNNGVFTFANTGTVVKADHFAATGTASGLASAAVYGWDATNSRGSINNNNGSIFDVAVLVGTGNVTTAGTGINAGTCQAQSGISVANSAVTDGVTANIGATLPATWQTGIVLSAHVTTAGTVTVYLCNPTAGTITPAATQVNVRVLR